MDNPCKHPIIVLKDIRGWEVQCIVDFMYKGETSVPEANLTSLIKAAESLKVRGLTSSDPVSTPSRAPSSLSAPPPPPPSHNSSSGYHGAPHPSNPHPPSHHARPSFSPSPVRSQSGYPSTTEATSEPASKIPHLQTNTSSSNSSQSSPMSLTNHQADLERHRASPGPAGSVSGVNGGPRRKQARPRRRSGDSIGNASLDLSKSDSPPLSSLSGASNNNGAAGGLPQIPPRSPHPHPHRDHRDHSAPPAAGTNSPRTKPMTTQHQTDETPENLSLNRPSSQPAINLVS